MRMRSLIISRTPGETITKKAKAGNPPVPRGRPSAPAWLRTARSRITWASFAVWPRNFSLISDFYDSCSAREGLQPIVPGAPWVNCRSAELPPFLGFHVSVAFAWTPNCHRRIALLGLPFRRRRSAAGAKTHATFSRYAPWCFLSQEPRVLISCILIRHVGGHRWLGNFVSLAIKKSFGRDA